MKLGMRRIVKVEESLTTEAERKPEDCPKSWPHKRSATRNTPRATV